MIFAKVDVNLTDHTKAMAAGVAMATWLWGLLYSRKHELDGLVPFAALKLSWVGEIVAREHSEALVAVGLWKRGRLGFAIQNYESKNETKADIGQRREDAKERMRAVRMNRMRTSTTVQRTPIRTDSEVPVLVSGSGSVLDPEGSAEGADLPAPTPEERYRAKFVAGVKRIRSHFVFADAQQGLLNQTIIEYAKSDDAKPLRGAALESWIETKVAEFVTFATSEDPKYWSGFQPKGFVRWLNEKCAAPPERAEWNPEKEAGEQITAAEFERRTGNKLPLFSGINTQGTNR